MLILLTLGGAYWWWRCWGPGWAPVEAARRRAELGPNRDDVPHASHSVRATTSLTRFTTRVGNLGVLTISANHIGLFVGSPAGAQSLVWRLEDNPTLVLAGPRGVHQNLTVRGSPGEASMFFSKSVARSVAADLDRYGWTAATVW